MNGRNLAAKCGGIHKRHRTIGSRGNIHRGVRRGMASWLIYPFERAPYSEGTGGPSGSHRSTLVQLSGAASSLDTESRRTGDSFRVFKKDEVGEDASDHEKWEEKERDREM